MSQVLEQVPQMTIPELPGCVIEVYPDIPEWLEARNSVIGASESASIFGLGYADESPMTVWARKRGLLQSKDDTEVIECGRVLQPSIIELFRRRYLRTNPDLNPDFRRPPLGEFTLCRSTKHHWLGASLDDYFVDGLGAAVVEAKNVGAYMAHEWDDSEPLKFEIQGQQQMAVTGTERCFVVGLLGGNKLVWRELHRNDRFIDAMINKLAEFQEMVDAGIEPPADASEATKKALQKIHPLDNGETIVLPIEAEDWHRAFAQAKADVKDAESRELEFGNKIRQAIGDNTGGLLGDGSRYTYKHGDKQVYCCQECGFVKRSAPFRTLRHQKASSGRRR